MVGKVLKPLGIVLLVATAITVWRGYVFFYGTPARVDTMALRQAMTLLLLEPQTMAYFTELDGTWLDFHSDDLNSRTQDHRGAQSGRLRQFLVELERYERETLAPDQELTYEVWSAWLEAEADASAPFYAAPPAVLSGPYEVDQLYGIHMFPVFMTEQHRVTNRKTAENYVSRLRAFGEAVDQSIATFHDDAENGVLAPRFILERVLRDIESFTLSTPVENLLVQDLVQRASATGRFNDDEIAGFRDEAIQTIEQVVYPALDRLIVAIESRLDEARIDQPGVLVLPGGPAYYAARVKAHTTTDYTPDELHEIGLREVARILNQMDTALVALGFDEASVPERMQQLTETYNYGLADSDAGRQELIAIANELIRQARRRSESFFARTPRASVEVRPIPAFATASASNSYDGPASDGTRPGYFNLNLAQPSGASAVGFPSLIYHETIPGHHFERARNIESELPVVRRRLPFAAYVEGWGLYAETLAVEMGLYDDNPAGRIGALRSELFRSVRLVVDTGLHHLGWSREEAADYMRSTLVGRPPEGAQIPEDVRFREIDRYIVDPGQALAYKAGQLKLMELRTRAEEALGDAFDIRDFHEEILKDGAMPLSVLDRKIDQWIESTRL